MGCVHHLGAGKVYFFFCLSSHHLKGKLISRVKEEVRAISLKRESRNMHGDLTDSTQKSLLFYFFNKRPALGFSK